MCAREAGVSNWTLGTASDPSAVEPAMIRQQQPDSGCQGRLHVAQIIAQLSVFLLELGQAHDIRIRLRQLLAGIVRAGIRKFCWLGCCHRVEKWTAPRGLVKTS